MKNSTRPPQISASMALRRSGVRIPMAPFGFYSVGQSDSRHVRKAALQICVTNRGNSGSSIPVILALLAGFWVGAFAAAAAIASVVSHQTGLFLGLLWMAFLSGGAAVLLHQRSRPRGAAEKFGRSLDGLAKAQSVPKSSPQHGLCRRCRGTRFVTFALRNCRKLKPCPDCNADGAVSHPWPPGVR